MSVSEKSQAILDESKKKFGFVPNMYEKMAISPSVLKNYTSTYAELMENSSFSGKEVQTLFLAISTQNDCHYCKAAHGKVSQMNGLAESDAKAIVEGHLPQDKRLASLVSASRLILDKQGNLTKDDMQSLDDQGVDKVQVFEIIAAIAVKTISNYVNHIEHTEIDAAFQ